MVGQWCNLITMEESGSLHVMYGTMDAEIEVQPAFLCLCKEIIGPTKVQLDNKGVTDGLLRGEMKCFGPKAGKMNCHGVERAMECCQRENVGR